MDQIPYTPSTGERIEHRPVSQLSIWSMILGIIFLCFGPLALVPLIMGIVGLTQTGHRGPKRGMGFAAAGTTLGAVGLLGTCVLGIFLPALGKARERAKVLVSEAQMRSQIQAAIMYAEEHDDQFPPESEWPDAVLDTGLISPEMLVSPLEDGDGVSYIYLGGEYSQDSLQIVLYEDPNHTEDRVLVGFADGHVEEMTHDELNRLLAEQMQSQSP